jgi:hypothetical protein
VPEAWRLRDAPLPAIRRGFCVAAPVGILLLLDFEVRTEVAGGLATAAMICGFLAFDAPARVRVRWQLTCAPLVGLAAGLGVLSSQSTVAAVAAMAVVASVCAYLVAVSLRLAVAGLTITLAVVISQGLFLEAADAPEAVLYGICGGLAQAAMAALTWLVADRAREGTPVAVLWRGGADKLRAALDWRSTPARHALRFGVALAVGVAIYRIAGFDDHGYWVPLTILFVLKPESSQTTERIAMRAAGTVFGLLFATGLAEIFVDDLIPVTIVLVTAAALAYALLAIEYALFTTAITVYVVLLTDYLGAGPFEAAGERALGTILGIAVAGSAFWVFGEVEERRLEERAERA